MLDDAKIKGSPGYIAAASKKQITLEAEAGLHHVTFPTDRSVGNRVSSRPAKTNQKSRQGWQDGSANGACCQA